MVIDPLKDDGAVGFGIIMIFEVDARATEECGKIMKKKINFRIETD